MKIHVILGSTRPNRFSEKPGKWILGELQKREGVEAELLDLRDYPLPFFDEPASPNYLKGQYSNEVATGWAKKISEADAYIIIAPEYNHGYPAVLKNALDYAYTEWNNKPVGFVSYGGVAGGTRSTQQLKEVVLELQMHPIRNGVHFSLYTNFLDEEGNLLTEKLQKNADAMIAQLLWWAKLLKAAREETKQP